MEEFESTIESPMLFFISFIKLSGVEYLHKQFVYPEANYMFYCAERDVIEVEEHFPWGYSRGKLIDEETNKYAYDLTFPEFVKFEFDRQFEITKGLINRRSIQNGDDQDLKLYKRLLLFCIKFHKIIDSSPELEFKNDLIRFTKKLFVFSYKKFESFHPKTDLCKRLLAYHKNQRNTNITGFKLKAQIRNAPLRETIELMFNNDIVTRKTKRESLEQFFDGEIPKGKIDWYIHPNEIYYFIDKISDSEILDRKPGHKWKSLDQMFTNDGVELPANWYRNCNKLKDNGKKGKIDELVLMLSPRR